MLAWLLLAVAAPIVVWRGLLWLRWWGMRRRLLAGARARGLDGSWPRGSTAKIAGYRLVTRRNLELRVTLGGRAITVRPESLGWRRETPPWTWWSILVHPLAVDPAAAARIPRFAAHVRRRDPADHSHPAARAHASGDAAFDAELDAYRYADDDPEANRQDAAAMDALLGSVEVREVLRALLTGPTDHASLDRDGLHLALRRAGASIEELQARLEQVTRLADAAVAALDRAGVYR